MGCLANGISTETDSNKSNHPGVGRVWKSAPGLCSLYLRTNHSADHCRVALKKSHPYGINLHRNEHYKYYNKFIMCLKHVLIMFSSAILPQITKICESAQDAQDSTAGKSTCEAPWPPRHSPLRVLRDTLQGHGQALLIYLAIRE